MRITDTDSKGLIVCQTDRGTYFALMVEETEESIKKLQKIVDYRKSGGKRRTVDSRKY